VNFFITHLGKLWKMALQSMPSTITYIFVNTCNTSSTSKPWKIQKLIIKMCVQVAWRNGHRIYLRNWRTWFESRRGRYKVFIAMLLCTNCLNMCVCWKKRNEGIGLKIFFESINKCEYVFGPSMNRTVLCHRPRKPQQPPRSPWLSSDRFNP
jgi:hypothetical protein